MTMTMTLSTKPNDGEDGHHTMTLLPIMVTMSWMSDVLDV